MRQVEAAKRLAEEEAQRRHLRVHLRRLATLFQLLDLEAAQVLRRCRIGRAAEKPRKRLHVLDVIVLRLLTEAAYGHALEHAAAKIAYGLVLHWEVSLRLGDFTPRSSGPGTSNPVTACPPHQRLLSDLPPQQAGARAPLFSDP
jgi:hypothetical protein